MVPKGKRITKPTSRHGGRVVLSLDVEPYVRDALRERAAANGVSMTEYVTNALANPDRMFATPSAAHAQVLTRISYEIARAREALDSADNETLVAALQSVRKSIADALRPLARSHDEEVRSLDRRCAGGWTG